VARAEDGEPKKLTRRRLARVANKSFIPRSAAAKHPASMARHLAIAALAAAMFCSLPAAHAQEDMPELDGGPPPLQIPKPAPKPIAPKPSPRTNTTDASKLKAEQALLARQAEAQKAEQLRLDRQAAELKAEQARLDARAAAIAAEEARLARLRAEQEIAETRLAERERQRVIAPPIESAELPEEPASLRARPRLSRMDYESARRACTRAGMDEALDRDFYSARYQSAPRLFDHELRGVMRMDDRRGYVLVDTLCELDDDGLVINFEMLR
jgi:hypothetical protein